jgi:hypothetical protein
LFRIARKSFASQGYQIKREKEEKEYSIPPCVNVQNLDCSITPPFMPREQNDFEFDTALV